jgi:hypothetical protein
MMGDDNPFIGTWKLISWKNTNLNREVTYPCGTHPIGYLLYTEDGYMAAEVMDPDRHQGDVSFPPEPALPDKERLRAHVTYLSYCGTYSYSMQEEMMTHHVKASSIPSWAGRDQTRHFEFKDGNLFLSYKGAQLIWGRAVFHA